MPEKEKVNIKELNVFEKMSLAKAFFHEKTVKKSGKHNSMGYSYFTLEDIIPNVLSAFKEYRLFNQVTFKPRTKETVEYAEMIVYNLDDISQKIVYTSPLKEITPILNKYNVPITNEIQLLGSAETYVRRYLYLIAFDIIEHDDSDSGSLTSANQVIPQAPKINVKTPSSVSQKPEKVAIANSTPVVKKNKIYFNEAEREVIKEQNVDVDGQASDIQLNKLQELAQKMQLTKNPKLMEYAGKMAEYSKMFTTVSRKNCESIIVKMSGLLKRYEESLK